MSIIDIRKANHSTAYQWGSTAERVVRFVLHVSAGAIYDDAYISSMFGGMGGVDMVWVGTTDHSTIGWCTESRTVVDTSSRGAACNSQC